MELINFSGIEAGDWATLQENEKPVEGASVAVPVDRVHSEDEQFFSTVGALGAIVHSDTAYSSLASLLNKLAFIAIDFPAFGDGRGFSLAVRLRKDLGFTGEIRATGDIIPDQAMHLLRSGFDTAEVKPERKAAFEASAKRFKQYYQSDYRGVHSIAHLRHKTLPAENRKAS